MNIFRGQFSIIFLLLFAGYNAANILSGNEESFLQYDETNPSFLDYRLPQTIIPTNYQIILAPQLSGDFTFKGVVHINAYVQKPTDTITLHHGKMEILTVSVFFNNDQKKIASSKYDNETEKFEIKLADILVAGINITINFEYTGVIRDDMVGFYRSSYIDSNGQLRWMVSTQFQKSFARHAFPCFDEPRFKATFIVRLLRPAGYTCLSNMPLNRSVKVNNEFWDEFKQSIPMSTYLVAFVISDFSSVKIGNFKVWAKPAAIEQARYALTIGTQVLAHFSKRFNQDYQISKMDMVAVPDFLMGAMENWGLVTYRESRLLYDENTSSDAAQQSIASVIAHELTHMWFGNTVTPEWWSYLWLSEAFARYFEYFGTAQVEKTWNMEDQFVVEQHQTAYAADGVESSQPMTRDVSNSSQMDGIADTITYNKGGSIVRMMNLIFGSDVFDAGLTNYLNNGENVARPNHLWSQLQNEINRRNKKLATSVAEIMTSWTEQAGFPVLSVSIGKGVANVTQERFLLRNLKSTSTKKTWWIPITFATKENPNFNTVNVVQWVSKEQDTVSIANSSDWVIFNVQSSGFYRVNYDAASWNRIINTLNSKNCEDIHVVNRAALIDDLLNLARSELLSYKTALDGLRYLTQEKHYLPFKAAFSALTYLDQRLSGNNEYYTQFKKFVLTLINDRYKELGYVDRPSDDRLTVLLRSELNKWACKYGHKGCVQTFTAMFHHWMEHKITIKPNQQATAYCMGVKHGLLDEWMFLWDQYYNSNSATEQVALIQALGCTEHPDIPTTYLSYALKPFNESRIRLQDNSAVFSSVHSNGVLGAEYVLNFVAKYHAEMKKFYNGSGSISSILSSASQRFSTKELVTKFENLIEQRKVEFDGILEPLRNSLEIAKYELRWFEKNAKDIMAWINAFNAEQNASSTTDTTDYRLPTSITPSSYNVWLMTDVNELDNFTFTGSVDINASVAQKTNKIVLHSSKLTHNSISVHAGDKAVTVVKTEKNEKYDFLIIELAQELQVGQKLTVAIEFAGHLNEEMRGFYKSSYMDENGKTSWLAATHLEPVGARKVFPCFDEPAMKATFTIRATMLHNYNAVSNMPIENIYLHANETKTIVFKETPEMSTYLVALVISDFASLKDNDEIYGVWARKAAINHGKYALDVMEQLVNYYGKTLDIPYQLPKLDMVALPDFVSGAMENWGLLTYKERNVLYDEELSTTASQQSVINIISHEITHQWFGNLVSPLWWKYLWLNEGFARYFQYFGTNGVQSNWSLESQFAVDHIQTALETDSGASTHAITHDVYSPTDILGIFDTISYAKAASVIRMMEKILGRDVFYKSLQNYLKKRQYAAATPDDLFNSFKEQITDDEMKKSFIDIMNSWTIQPGYPVVRATIEGSNLKLQQERFFLKQQEASSQSTWHIPISWSSLKQPNFEDTKPKYWFRSAEDSIKLPNDDLYVLNVQQSGFYRVNYDTQTWEKIIDFLKTDRFTALHEINRAAIIDDLFNFGRAGLVSYNIVLSATEYLKNETSYVPWRAFFNGITYLHKQYEGRDSFDAFKRYVSSIITPIYDELRFADLPEDTHVTKLLRSHVRSWACKLDISNCKANAIFNYKLWTTSGVKIPANSLGVTYCTVARQNDPYEWAALWRDYVAATFTAQKSLILQSLACTTDKDLLTTLLNNAISQDRDIRFQDSSSVFTSVINASPEGVESVMDFVQDNYAKMVDYFQEVSSVNSIVNSIGRKVFTDQHYIKYVHLLNWLEERIPAGQATVKTYANRADSQLKWAEYYIPKINSWLEGSYPRMDYRLPKSFLPFMYNLSLAPYFMEKNFRFTGNVQIQLSRRANYISHIYLHANGLSISNVEVYHLNSNSTKGKALGISGYVENHVTQTLSIFTREFIKSDNILLDIGFKGTLSDNMFGFYRSHYVDAKGDTRWLAATLFQATYARNAFPCFDEPSFKSTFAIHIERPKNYAVLSNMPRLSSTPSESADRVWDSFQETVKMSTYMVAFVISDFVPVVNSVESVNVWGRPEIAGKGELARVTALRALDYLYMETGHKYSLPKLDLVGVPDSYVGAMENWGLATFKESGLFYDRNVTTAKYTDKIITTIGHELAHMLFGNLVTCEWWEYIWLNEGFATYMQWRLAHLFRPSYDFENLFVVDELQAALLSDGSPSTKPMNNPVRTPAEIEGMYTTVSYGKSSSVIRMFQKSTNPGIFSRAMYQYLRRYQFSNTTPKDLWKVLDEAIQETGGLGDWIMSTEKIMDGWTNKQGYPVVSATLNANRLTLTQKSFFTYKNIKDFMIPITLTTASEMNFVTTWTDLWLTDTALDIYIKNPDEWFILNIQQSGYYRVNYDAKSWSRLIKALEQPSHSLIHVTNRAQIIDDLLNLARAGYVDYDIALNGTAYLQKEAEHMPWKAFYNGISFILQRYEGQNDEKLVKQYSLLLADGLYRRLGFIDKQNETHHDQLSRELMLSWMCKLEHNHCVTEARQLFNSWRNSNRTITPNARPAVYCTGIKYGSKQDWEFLWQQYLSTNFASEKLIILNALGCSRDKEILKTYIQYALKNVYTSPIRKQDVSAVFASIYNADKFGVDVILDFLVKDYKKLYDFYGNWDGVEQLISKIAPRLSTQDQVTTLDELQTKESKNTILLNAIESAIEAAIKNLDWYAKKSLKISKWMTAKIAIMQPKNSGGRVTPNNISIITTAVFTIIMYILSH